METVQLQCGHCKQVIAISVEHLGGQVQCPHCKGVLQTPARTPPEPMPEVAPLPNMELKERESIFATADSSDQVLGEPEAPKVEMPSIASATPSEEAPAAAPESGTDLTQFKQRRPVFDRGVVALYGFIFLIPYAILTTLAVLYLVFARPAPTHPFDMMPDPLPDKGKGGARKAGMIIKHDSPLADHQHVAVGKTIQVGKDGDLEATPQRLRLTEQGDLKLYLRVKNISPATAFEPMHDTFVRYTPKKDAIEPYTFIEAKGVEKIYNPFLEYRKGLKEEDEAGKSLLAPGEETTIVLTTNFDYRKSVAELAKAKETMTWRVHLRRGFVKYKEKDVSATAVIGVDFTSDQIVRDGKS